MTANDFQKTIMKYLPVLEGDEQLLYGLVGLNGEAGEAIDIVKKQRWQGHELDTAHLKSELGDVACCLAYTASALGVDLEEIFEINIKKLQARYPNGFDPELSIHRKPGDI